MSDHDPTLGLAKQLIRCQSVTPEDGGCQQILSQRLTAIGFDCQSLRYGEVDNLWARHGSASPLIVFAGHTDVVPTGPVTDWKHDPFAATEDNGKLYGRGSADMKSSVAAFITAIESFVEDNPNYPGSIGLLVTSDEEGPAVNGTVKVMEYLAEHDIKIDYCVVGEPTAEQYTGDIIKNGRRGSLGGILTVHGKQGHVAYPHLAENPIHRLAPALAGLTTETWDNGSEHFPATSFQISNYHAGTGANNVIPGHVELEFNFRFSTAVTVEQLKNRIHSILDQHNLNYDLDWNLSGMPFLTASGKLVEAARVAIKQQLDLEPQLSTSGGTSDGRFIAPTGAEVLEIGPCNKTIHQVDECVELDDPNKLARVYRALLKQLLV